MKIVFLIVAGLLALSGLIGLFIRASISTRDRRMEALASSAGMFLGSIAFSLLALNLGD